MAKVLDAKYVAVVIRLGLFLRDTFYNENDHGHTNVANKAIRGEMFDFIMSHSEMSKNQHIRTFAEGLVHTAGEIPTPVNKLLNDFRAAMQYGGMDYAHQPGYVLCHYIAILIA